MYADLFELRVPFQQNSPQIYERSETTLPELGTGSMPGLLSDQSRDYDLNWGASKRPVLRERVHSRARDVGHADCAGVRTELGFFAEFRASWRICD